MIALRTMARLGVLVAGLLLSAGAAAQKTDVITLFNGNEIIGEVKELYRGLLRYSTDSMGTIYVEWLDIKAIRSDKRFTVETAAGTRAFGSLSTSGDFSSLEVSYSDRTVRFEKYAVVAITRIKDTFLSRIDGSVEGGVTFRKADSDLQLNFALNLKYTSRKHRYNGGLSAIVSGRSNQIPTERYTLDFSHQAYLRPKWLSLESAQLEQNTELDLRLRALILGGAAYRFLYTNRNTFDLASGLGLNNESYFTESKGERTSLEAFVSVGYEYFKFNTPKADVVFRFTVFPSLTESGRVRSQLDGSVSWEVIEDLMFKLTTYASTDNDPPVTADGGDPSKASGSDYGVILSLGWTF